MTITVLYPFLFQGLCLPFLSHIMYKSSLIITCYAPCTMLSDEHLQLRYIFMTKKKRMSGV